VRGSGDDRRRLTREIEHDRKILEKAEAIWGWDSPVGRARALRRAGLFIKHAELGPGRRALELGCGTGLFLEHVARSGAEIHGLDISEELLERARKRLPGASNVRFTRGSAMLIPYPNACFDAVYGSSILHHLDLEAAFSEVFRVLRPGGPLIFAEPNIFNPHIAFVFLLAPREPFGLSPDEMAFSRFAAARALRRKGFERVSVRPYDFLHPVTPEALINWVSRLGRGLESVPLVREIAGSLVIQARRP